MWVEVYSTEVGIFSKCVLYFAYLIGTDIHSFIHSFMHSFIADANLLLQS
jgi:hypothetical protein